MSRPSRHSGALEYLYERFYAGRPARIAALEKVRLDMDIAQQIYELRTAAGLTQRQLATRVGTTASVICQLEDSDYSGRSLSLLHRIATALSSRIEFRFVPLEKERSVRPRGKKKRKST